MRSQSQNTCKSCDHWYAETSATAARAGMLTNSKQQGQCKRFPPIPVAILTPEGPLIINARGGTSGDEPGCGEFKPVLSS